MIRNDSVGFLVGVQSFRETTLVQVKTAEIVLRIGMLRIVFQRLLERALGTGNFPLLVKLT